ncbi:MAG: hypothetical protein RHS_4774 [Robinsoniella sp. RHS]|uniref:response regulator transcription factor n=1 Tax=Robinsoniella sp. RHS TaxID=1504536 RepID=UPI0006497854|nr:MAG: hypothetical protein RHS_4774 [Robinsoniella sp. RHS]
MKYRYLIIDDEKLARLGTLEKLSPINDRITCAGEAADGDEGIALVEKLHPDIIITDMKMPIMDGEQLLPLLAEKYPQIQIIVISGYRDFEYSRQAIRASAIDYILKPFGSSEIISAVEQAITRIENQTEVETKLQSSEKYKEALHLNHDREQLRNLICGYSESNLHLSSERLKFINQSHSCLFVLLRSEQPLPEDEISLLLSDRGYDNMALYLPHPHAENLGFFLLFFPARTFFSAESVCHEMIENLKALFLSRNEQVIYGVSREHRHLLSLHNAFQESIQALNQMKVQDDTYIFTITDTPAPKSILWERTDQLLFRIEAGMNQEVDILVKDLFSYYQSLTDATFYEIKCSCFQITNQVKLMLNQYIQQIQADSVDTSIQNILDTMFSLEELCRYYRQFFGTISQALAPDNVYSDSDIVNNVKTYIDRNFYRDISVEFVASLFHMNRSYLSHIFKKKQGKTFIDYLNLVRVSESKILLKNSDKKLYQIAKAVGYDNVSYFCRVFKKLEQMTPEQYRG